MTRSAINPVAFLTRRRGGKGWHWTDVVTFGWLALSLVMIFGPALWLLLSSFKPPAQLAEFPPTILPYAAQTATVVTKTGPKALPLYTVELPDGSSAVMAELNRVGIMANMVRPEAPDDPVKVNINARKPLREVAFATDNYTTPLKQFDFARYLRNSVFVTTMATIITLITNSMAAFALSKYEFRGRNGVMMVIVATLMIPLSVNLVPLYSVVSSLGLMNNLWGVILPTVATPTGVFMLRQYMLTIPDELIEAAAT